MYNPQSKGMAGILNILYHWSNDVSILVEPFCTKKIINDLVQCKVNAAFLMQCKHSNSKRYVL